MTAAHDHAFGALVGTGLQALGRLAPGRTRVTAAVGTTAVRVIDRIHTNTANRRTPAAPAIGACLADDAQTVLAVADFADGGAAVDVHLADFTAAQTQLR